MLVEVFLEAWGTSNSVGTAEVQVKLVEDRLQISGSKVHKLYEHIERVEREVNPLEFTLVAGGLAFHRCRMVGMGEVMTVSFFEPHPV